MDFPKELKYSKDHEWVRIVGDTATVGITDYAQHALGDIVYVELPKVGADLSAGKGAAVVESVKSVSDVFAPLSGKVTEINPVVSDKPELINQSPYGAGWMFKIKAKDNSEAGRLMGPQEYEKFVSELKK